MAATKGLMDFLFMAVCEWFLMFWVFIDAALASSLTKFAQYCELQIPCVLCSRLDRFFGNEKLGSYLNLFCNKHQADISYWIYCDLHNKLVDVREMCENCLRSVTSQSQFDLEPYRFLVGAIGREKEGYRRSYLNNNFVRVSSCSCCKRQWKAKLSGQGEIQPYAFESGVSKVTTKPPLPHVARRGRSRRQESSKKMRNKVKHRRMNDLSPVGFSGAKLTSDSEFELLFSDDDDGYFNMVGIGERSWTGDSVTNGGRILGRHSYSTSDIGSALLLEAQLNENLRTRTRSASLTPNVMQFLGKTKENDLLKAEKDKKSASSMNSSKEMDSLTNARNRVLTSLDKSDGRRSLDGSIFSCSSGSQNLYQIFSRHSFSASDLQSALFLEMHLDRTLPRRSASLTPTSSSGYGLGEFKRRKLQGRPTHSTEPSVPLKAKKNKKSSSSTDVRSDLPLSYLEKTRGHGYLNDSVVSRSTRNRNRRKIPRRHSYSTYEVGCALLLEMHRGERPRTRSASLTPNCLISHGLEETKKLESQTRSGPSRSPELNSLSTGSSDKTNGFGSWDDSVVSCNTSSRNQTKIPRRHSCSVFQMGCEILLNMPINESLASRSASLAPNGSIGHGMEESTKSKFQTRPSHSHSPELPPTSSVKRFSSSSDFRSDLSTVLDKTKGRGSLDDSVVARRTTASQNQNNIPRRHSYSAFDLGRELLVEMHLGESLTRRSASLTPNDSIGYGLGEPKKSQFQTRPSSSHSLEFRSVNLVQLPHQQAKRAKKSLPSMNSIEGLGSSSDVRRDSLATSTNRYGSLDDSVVSRNAGGHDKNKNPRRHSYSAFELGCALLMHMDESLRHRSASVTPNGSIFHGSEEPKKLKSQTRPSTSRSPELSSLNAVQFPQQKREKDALPPTSSVKRFSSSSSSDVRKSKWYGSLDDTVVSRSTRSQNQNEIPRRHSLSAFDLGRALCIEMHLAEILKSCNASLGPNSSTRHGLEELNWLKFQNRASRHSSELNVVQFHPRKAMKDKKPLPSPDSINRLGSSSDVRSDVSTISLDKPNGYGSWDDSVVSRNTGSRNQNNIPRRHSCTVLQMDCEILLNMPVDESLTSRSASLAPNGSTGHGLEEPTKSKLHTKPSHSHSSELGSQKGEKDKNPLPPTGAVKRFGSSSDVRSDLSTGFLDKTKWQGSLDDLIVSRNTSSQNHNTIPRRHSYSAFDLGRALLVGMHLDESLKRCNASLAPNSSTGHGFGELNPSKFQNKPSPHSSEYSSHNVVQFPHQKAKRDKKPLPLPSLNNRISSSSDVTSDLLTASFYKIDGYGSLDDSVVIRRTSSHTQYTNPRRHSYSAYEVVCAPLLDIYRDESLTNRSVGHKKEEENHHKNPKKDEPSLPPMNPIKGLGSSADVRSDLPSSFIHKPDGHGPFDDSVVYSRDNQNRHMNLAKNSYSTSDLRSPLPEMHLDESLTSKSASLTPNCSIGQGLGELKGLKFQTGTNTSSQEFGYLDAMRSPRRKRKKHDHSKAKKNKKSLASANYVKVMSSSTNDGSDLPTASLDKTSWYGSFDDSVVSNNTGSRNRHKIFSRHSQSAADLRSELLLEMHHDDGPRRRSASVTPDCSTGHGLGELKWSKFQTGPPPHSPELDSLNAVQFPNEEAKKRDPQEVKKDKKPLPPMNPAKEMDFPTNIRSDVCPTCFDKFSVDGSSVSELELDGTVKMKQQAEDDLRCMRLLQSELEAERNAATVAAHHAMNMITRLQEEKASLQMEALQYLRMMEEQAEYDMEALQKANELVEEKENEIQDLLEELEQYRRKYGDESTRYVLAPVKSLEDEKRYVLQSLSTLEKKLHQLSSGMSNGDAHAKPATNDPLKDEYSLPTQKDSSISNGVHDKPLENENLVDSGKKLVSRDGGEVDLATMVHEIAYLKEKMETLEDDLDFLKHACNTLHASEGFEFIEEIAHQLQDLRRFMLDRKYISTN